MSIEPLNGRESYPSRGKEIIVTGTQWLKDKQLVDNQINPKHWIVRNKVYDLTKFIQSHPGGPQWLELTQGQDITDFYESYHVNQDKVNKSLEKFYVSDVKNPTQGFFSYEEKGFYKTLQKRITKIFEKEKDRRATLEMQLSSFAILMLWITSFIFMGFYQSYLLSIFAGILLNSVLGVGHNFLHQPNNIWYYALDLTSFGSLDWTI